VIPEGDKIRDHFLPTPKIETDWDGVHFLKSFLMTRLDWYEKPSEGLAVKIRANWQMPSALEKIEIIQTDWQKTSKMPVDDHWSLPFEVNKLTRKLKLNSEQKRFREAIYPLSGEYESEVPSIFLHRLQNLSALNAYPLTIARDGSLSLIYFFEKFQRPKGLKSKIAVEKSLLSLVPKTWHAHIASYRLASGPSDSKNECVFLYGINSAALINSESCLNAIETAKPYLENAKRIYLCLPCHFLSSAEPIHMHTEVARLIFSKIGTSVRVVDWGHFLQLEDAKNSEIVSLNKMSLVADSWLTHALMKRGSTLANSSAPGSESFYPVSLSHGFAVEHYPRLPKISDHDRNKQIKSLKATFEHSVFDWKLLFPKS